MRWYKAIFNSFGAMGGIYGCIELTRVIVKYWTSFRFHLGFLLELPLIILGSIWITCAFIDIMFVPSDLLGLGSRGKGLIGKKERYIKQKD